MSLKPCPKGTTVKAHALKVLHHLHCAPAVKCDLTDIELITEPLDEFFDVAVMNDIALRGHVSLPLP
jgi:hypothetical protein